MPESYLIYTKAQWEESFKPITNPLDSSRKSFGPAKEEIVLLDNYEGRYIWTLLWDFYEEQRFLSPGLYPPDDSDQDIYYVTESPWNDEKVRVIFPNE